MPENENVDLCLLALVLRESDLQHFYLMIIV